MLQSSKPDSKYPLYRGILIAVGVAILVINIAFVCAFVFAKQVVISADGSTNTVTTNKNTVGELLAERGVKLQEGDKVSPELTEKLKNNDSVTVYRAVLVTISLDGNVKSIRTVSKTVGDVLDEYAIVLSEYDECNLPLDDELTLGLLIEVNRVSVEDVPEEEVLGRKIIRRDTSELLKGQTRVVEEGRDGILENWYRIVCKNGVEISREFLGDYVREEPVDKIIEVGTRAETREERIEPVSRGDLRFKVAYVMNASGYDIGYESTGKRPGDAGYGVTATGMTAKRGVVAVDPKVIPLGSRLYVETADGSYVYGYAIAGDTGGSIRGMKIDLCFDSRQEALRFGRKTVNVYVLE